MTVPCFLSHTLSAKVSIAIAMPDGDPEQHFTDWHLLLQAGICDRRAQGTASSSEDRL